MNIVDQLIGFINGIINAIKALVEQIRHNNDYGWGSTTTTAASSDADTDVIA